MVYNHVDVHLSIVPAMRFSSAQHGWPRLPQWFSDLCVLWAVGCPTHLQANNVADLNLRCQILLYCVIGFVKCTFVLLKSVYVNIFYFRWPSGIQGQCHQIYCVTFICSLTKSSILDNEFVGLRFQIRLLIYLCQIKY